MCMYYNDAPMQCVCVCCVCSCIKLLCVQTVTHNLLVLSLPSLSFPFPLSLLSSFHSTMRKDPEPKKVHCTLHASTLKYRYLSLSLSLFLSLSLPLTSSPPSSLMCTMLVRTSPVLFSLHSLMLVPWSSRTQCLRRSCVPSWSCTGPTVRGC